MSKETIVKMSYKAHTLRRFENTEFSTNKYRPNWNTPTNQGYKYNDFGSEFVREIEDKYQAQFQSRAMLLIADAINQLEQDVKDLGDSLEAEMMQDAISRLKSKQLELA